MRFNLTEDLVGPFDLLGPKGSTSILFIENDAGTAVIETASFNDAGVPPDNDQKIRIVLAAYPSLNILDLTINGVQDTDEVRLKEDGGDGSSRLLKKFRGSEPVQRFQIHAI
jgi:hypothetical protein